jgi:small subunit ribosomal protein S6
MSKTKKSGPANYEILFVVSNRFTEDEAKVCIAKVEKIITDNDGTIVSSTYWGKKKLAYPIKHETYGYYQLIEFDLEGKNLSKLDEKLRLDSEILRFMVTTRLVKSEKQIAKEEKIKAKIDSKKTAMAKEKAEKASEAEVKKPKKATKEKVNMENLDEKLEGILNAKDLI